MPPGGVDGEVGVGGVKAPEQKREYAVVSSGQHSIVRWANGKVGRVG